MFNLCVLIWSFCIADVPNCAVSFVGFLISLPLPTLLAFHLVFYGVHVFLLFNSKQNDVIFFITTSFPLLKEELLLFPLFFALLKLLMYVFTLSLESCFLLLLNCGIT